MNVTSCFSVIAVSSNGCSTESRSIRERDQIASLAQKNKLPSIYAQREYVDAGGLMSYGPSAADTHRRAATYVDKILKGTKPADLPVEQPRNFELVINLKTAKSRAAHGAGVENKPFMGKIRPGVRVTRN